MLTTIPFGIHFWLASLCLSHCVNCAQAQPIGADSKSNIEQIKEYITVRPAVAIAVVRSRNDLISRNDLTNSKFQYATYQGARQDGNFYVRKVIVDADENEMFNTNTVEAFGRSELIAWQAGHKGNLAASFFTIKTALDENDAIGFFRVGHLTNKVAQIASSVGGLFNRFLDFGLIDMRSGAVWFDGNKFRVQLNRGREAQGELLSKDGIVTGIKYQIKGDEPYVISEFDYDVSAEGPSFFPAKITQKVYDGGGSVVKTNMIFSFFRLRLAESNLNAGYFLPDRFDPSYKNPKVSVSRLELTNGVTYQIIDGKKVELQNASKRSFAKKDSQVFLVILCLLAVVGVFLIFGFFSKNKS